MTNQICLYKSFVQKNLTSHIKLQFVTDIPLKYYFSTSLERLKLTYRKDICNKCVYNGWNFIKFEKVKMSNNFRQLILKNQKRTDKKFTLHSGTITKATFKYTFKRMKISYRWYS